MLLFSRPFLLFFCFCCVCCSSCGVTLIAAAGCTVASQRVQCGSLTCNATSGDCIPCTISTQCYDPAMICRVSSSAAKTDDDDTMLRCKLMPIADLFGQRLAGTTMAVLTAVLVCAVAVVAGVGGGGLLTPLFQVLLGAPLVQAVGLSQATIVGQASFNIMLQVQRYHPQAQPPGPTRPVINYPLICFWLPIALVGTMWGNLIGKLTPDWARMMILLVLVGYALKRTITRMLAQRREDENLKAEAASSKVHHGGPPSPVQSLLKHKKEDAEEDEQRMIVEDDDDDDDDDETTGGVIRAHASHKGLLSEAQHDEGCGKKPRPKKPVRRLAMAPPQEAMEMNSAANIAAESSSSPSVDVAGDDNNVEEMNTNNKRSKEEEEQDKHGLPQFPPMYYAIVLAVFLPLTAANVIKNRLVDCNSVGFWLLTLCITCYNLFVSWKLRRYLGELNEKIRQGDEDINEHLVPFQWNVWTTVYFPIISVTAGLAASLTGLGGGILVNILLLEAGLTPEETSATGGFVTFLVASEALLQFIIQDAVRGDYFGVFFAGGLCATALGQLLIMPEIKRRGWRFLIVAALAVIMLGSMVATTAVGIYDTVTLVQNGGSVGFGGLCEKASKSVHHGAGNHH